MAIIDFTKLSCSIDFNDEWIQDGCHWKYDRIFTITTKSSLNSGTLAVSYTLGNSVSYTTEYLTELKNGVYELRLSSFYHEDLASLRDEDGYLKITAKATRGSYEATDTYEYLLKLPPKCPLTNLKVETVSDSAAFSKCSWTAPGVFDSDLDAVHGYCIELYHKPAGETNFTVISGLQVRQATISSLEGTGSIIYKDATTITAFGETGTEIYLSNTSFYFEAKQLGINPGDKYAVRVYPYFVYSSYLEKQSNGSYESKHGAYLSSHYTEVNNKTSKGIVRVKKSATEWVEGQVWVCVKDLTSPSGIKWVEAEAIYTKTNDGWKEAQ